MVEFRRKLLIFILLLLVLMACTTTSSRFYMDKGDFYTLKPETTNLILGHSQTECGRNDGLIAQTRISAWEESRTFISQNAEIAARKSAGKNHISRSYKSFNRNQWQSIKKNYVSLEREALGEKF